MKISPKLKEIVKRGTCTLVASLIIGIPFGGRGETKVESNINDNHQMEQQYQQVVTVDATDIESEEGIISKALELVDCTQNADSYPEFVLVTHWEKTDNYNEGKNYSKGNREYKRVAYRFKMNENINIDYFENDLAKMVKFFRDNENSSEIFDLIEEYEQVITVSPEEEKNLNTTMDAVEIVGTNIILKINSQQEEESNQHKRILRIAALIMYLGFIGLQILTYKRNR